MKSEIILSIALVLVLLALIKSFKGITLPDDEGKQGSDPFADLDLEKHKNELSITTDQAESLADTIHLATGGRAASNTDEGLIYDSFKKLNTIADLALLRSVFGKRVYYGWMNFTKPDMLTLTQLMQRDMDTDELLVINTIFENKGINYTFS
jgi:hypothetical protein